MKVVQIHSGTLGSIGKIIADLSATLDMRNIENYALLADCSRVPKPDNYLVFSSFGRSKVNRLLGRFTGFNNCFSFTATRNLIAELQRIRPDIIHLHNLHDGYVNTRMLFQYLSRCGATVVWTLHDCWSFTGKCPHFAVSGCQKWKTECGGCPVLREYPKAELDRTRYLFRLKKKAFHSVERLHLVAPSRWLADRVGESFLKDIPVSVINNGINPAVFHPEKSDLRERYHLEGKQIILGVAAPFTEKKGARIFERLAGELPEQYALVMIGLDDAQISSMPENIVRIRRTANQQELAQWYTATDVFVNPTYEDVLPTTSIEAQACGTPVIAFDSGGSRETFSTDTGILIERGNYEAMKRAIVEGDYRRLSPEDCVQWAKRFDKERMAAEYVALYRALLGK